MGIFADFWRTLEARNWDAFGALLADDVEGTWPQSRERCRGRAALVRFMREFPGDWHVRVVQEQGDPTGGATRIEFTDRGETVQAATFFTLDTAGRIVSLVEFWPEPYEPPDRQGTLERY